MATLAELGDACRDVVDIGVHPAVRADRQAPRPQEVVDLALRVDRRVGPCADAVHVQRQGLDARDAGLQLEAGLLVQHLPQAATGGVARVGERREPATGTDLGALAVDASGEGFGDHALAQVGLQGVEPVERLDGDEHLAPHLDQGWVTLARESLGQVGELDRVGRDVLADASVAPGGGRDEHPVLVPQRDGESVDLGLGEPGDRARRGGLGLGAPGPELVGREHVVEAEHALGVLDGCQVGARRRAHPLRGRVLALQGREQPLERLETLHVGVVGGVVDERGVAPVVGVARLLDALDQCLDLDPGVVEADLEGLLRIGSLGRRRGRGRALLPWTHAPRLVARTDVRRE